MSKLISAEKVLAMIAEAKTSFAISAVSNAPKNEHAAWYHHGIQIGFDAVSKGVEGLIAEDENKEETKGGFRNGYR